MKIILLALLFTTAVNASEIIVNVNGLRSTDGSVQVAVWKTADGFPDDYNMSWAQMTVPTTLTRAMFRNAEPGFYAVAVFHDKNEDNDLNRNGMGIPTEGFGFSNNPRIIFGPPKFKKAKFKVGEGETKEIEIELKHF